MQKIKLNNVKEISKVGDALRGLDYSVHPYEVSIKQVKPTRSLEQNAKMWAMLNDISDQVQWYQKSMKPEDWKDLFTSALNEKRAIPSLDGYGVVMLGARTSKMTIQQMIDVITIMEAFGAANEVKFSAKEQ